MTCSPRSWSQQGPLFRLLPWALCPLWGRSEKCCGPHHGPWQFQILHIRPLLLPTLNVSLWLHMHRHSWHVWARKSIHIYPLKKIILWFFLYNHIFRCIFFSFFIFSISLLIFCIVVFIYCSILLAQLRSKNSLPSITPDTKSEAYARLSVSKLHTLFEYLDMASECFLIVNIGLLYFRPSKWWKHRLDLRYWHQIFLCFWVTRYWLLWFPAACQPDHPNCRGDLAWSQVHYGICS